MQSRTNGLNYSVINFPQANLYYFIANFGRISTFYLFFHYQAHPLPVYEQISTPLLVKAYERLKQVTSSVWNDEYYSLQSKYTQRGIFENFFQTLDFRQTRQCLQLMHLTTKRLPSLHISTTQRVHPSYWCETALWFTLTPCFPTLVACKSMMYNVSYSGCNPFNKSWMVRLKVWNVLLLSHFRRESWWYSFLVF